MINTMLVVAGAALVTLAALYALKNFSSIQLPYRTLKQICFVVGSASLGTSTVLFACLNQQRMCCERKDRGYFFEDDGERF